MYGPQNNKLAHINRMRCVAKIYNSNTFKDNSLICVCSLKIYLSTHNSNVKAMKPIIQH